MPQTVSVRPTATQASVVDRRCWERRAEEGTGGCLRGGARLAEGRVSREGGESEEEDILGVGEADAGDVQVVVLGIAVGAVGGVVSGGRRATGVEAAVHQQEVGVVGDGAVDVNAAVIQARDDELAVVIGVGDAHGVREVFLGIGHVAEAGLGVRGET